jgi:uncharacterized protein YegP (UPF0339 family)
MKRIARRCFMGLIIAGMSCSLALSAAQEGRSKESGEPQAPKATATFAGDWSETWGTPGQTDVTYHDHYRISQAGDGTFRVTILNRNQRITDERVENNTITFTQKTDAFLVKYSLALQPDGQWLIGTATTPKQVVNVKWQRVNSDVPRATLVGRWSEHWGAPGQTDVTYHDQYSISRADNGTYRVTILNRNQAITDERVVDDTITFTQKTDAFFVRYSLTLQPDNQWLIGTATTPQKVVDVKWERVN